MSNTLIQIKRSLSTASPTTLSIGELAYSYQSNTLFIGNTSGSGVIAIAGAGTTDISNSYATAVGIAGNTYANAIGSAGNAYAVSVGTAGNAYAASVGTSANVYADGVGTAANNFAGVMANSANAYATATYLPLAGGTLTGDLNITANLTVTGTTTYVNTQSLLVSDNIFILNSDLSPSTPATQDAGMEINRGSDANVSLLWLEGLNKWGFTNDGSSYLTIASNTDITNIGSSSNAYADAVGTAANAHSVSVGTAGNTYAEAVGTAGNAYAVAVGTAGNAYAVSVGTAGNTYATSVGTSGNAYAVAIGSAGNTYAEAVGTAGNNYASAVGSAANTNAANASYISTGTLAVSYGGTGVGSFTANGVIFGNGTGALQVTAAGTEGQVLQATAAGIPQFGMLDGGAF